MTSGAAAIEDLECGQGFDAECIRTCTWEPRLPVRSVDKLADQRFRNFLRESFC